MMPDRRNWRDVLKRFLHSWQAPAAVGVIILVAMLLWLMPRRVEQVVPVDGREPWDAAGAPPRRQVVWEPARELPGVVPEEPGTVRLVTPRLTDGGATLYLARRSEDGRADIFRSRLVDGRWRPAEPVEELNTADDELGPVLSRDGRRIYFYSNRRGGRGGYDLYVSERTEQGWGAPRNLGPQINTAADEYDPAVSPDGLTFYFASNRTDEMHVAAAAGDSDPSPPWTATLRARRGRATFDLYASRRESDDGAWAAAEPVAALNLPESNEGAPFVSPDGAFLYFASDRPARDGEAPNLDLYRARLIDGRFSSPENLGPTVNTGAHETEPGLSPEGFTLVFSSDRQGADRLFVSTAQEVYAHREWDASHLGVLSGIWWWLLLATLLIAALLAYVIHRYHDRVAEKVWAARFFLGGVLVNLLLLLLLIVWKLPDVVEVIAQQFKEETTPAPQVILDEEQDPSEGDRRPAFEKVADLPSLEDTPQVDAPPRQEVDPAAAPQERMPAPTIPRDRARLLPPERVAVVPPSAQAQPDEPQTAKPQAMRRATASPKIAAVEPQEVRLEAAEVPAEQPVEQNIELGRQEAMARPAEMPARPAARLHRTAELPTIVEVRKAEPSELPPVDPPEAAERLVRAPQQKSASERVKTLAESVTPVAAATTPDVRPAEGTVDLPRSDLPGPAPLKPEAKPTQPFRPQAESIAFRQQSGFEIDEPRPERAATKLARSVRSPSGIDDLDEADADRPIELAESKTPAESAPESAKIVLPRADSDESDLAAPAAADLPRSDLGLKMRLVSHSLDVAPNGTAEDAIAAIDPSRSLPERSMPRPSRLALRDDFANLQSMFTLRKGELRRQHIEILGGTRQSEEAVDRGLEWLAAHQNPDGSWSLNRFHENCKGKHETCTGAGSEASDTAATGFGLLPLLVAGNTHRTGKHQQTVARGLKWIVDHQKPDGDLLAPGSGQHMYSHAIAAIALCEAYGMTKDPELKEPAQKSLDFIVKAQHEPSGGWRYSPNQSGDTSVVGWQVMALKSGEMAGLNIPQKTFDGVHRWLKSVEGNQPVGGTFGYTSRGATPAMTAEGLLCLQLLRVRRSDPRILAGADHILKHPPERSQSLTSYYWYYASQAMYHMQGRYWDDWNQPMRDLLVETQIKDGHMAGTWAPADQWERRAGRVYSTSLKLLTLEAYYRYLPLYGQLQE